MGMTIVDIFFQSVILIIFVGVIAMECSIIYDMIKTNKD